MFQEYIYGGNEINLENNGDINYNDYGYNTSVSIAYHIPTTSVTISLGDRYHSFKTVYEDTEVNSEDDHKYFGFTVSTALSFGI